MILEQYDREPWGILRPDHVVKRRDGFPETVVFEFSEAVIRETARLAGGEIAGKLISTAGTTPVYKINYKGRELGICQAFIGAAACVIKLLNQVLRLYIILYMLQILCLYLQQYLHLLK